MNRVGDELTERQANYLFFNKRKNKLERYMIVKINHFVNYTAFWLYVVISLFFIYIGSQFIALVMVLLFFAWKFFYSPKNLLHIRNADNSLLFSFARKFCTENEDYEEVCMLREESLKELHEKFRSLMEKQE